MTLTAGHCGQAAPAPPQPLIPARQIGNGALWLAVFLSGFVIREPAPYEVYMLGLLAVWMACGLKLRREFAPLIIALLLYIAGGLASTPMTPDIGDAVFYIAITAFLALTAIFYAAVIAEDPDRCRIIRKAYITSAVLVSSIGIAGYFELFPGAGYFTLYDRARGTFQDPNVFGPFLVLPALFLVQDILRAPLRRTLPGLLALILIVGGIFLSFSRGAWGGLALSGLILYLITLIHVRSPLARLRLIGLGALGCLGVIGLLGVALSFDTVFDMFQQRARLVQEYDAARLGRFARHALGFEMVLEKPFGIGPQQFNTYFPEDEHNVYLKAFTTHGWLGGVTYLILAVWTLLAMVPLLFQNRPWTPFLHCIFAAFAAHMILGAVIDTDRWRHMWMLFGLAWGLIAASRLDGAPLGQFPVHLRRHAPV
ncbi:O-antigen polymerase [Roseibium aquae]|uniref:O-antigen polymerase n=1 Tax=Roseibium aquae TaxID=1323746 RepID=A0A916TMD7_9HYPH|nr:O-antigen ligase family protein [Roseibium aquae]GGB54949.1 O-antigen polymerase [Roseibium aquae]